MHFFKVILFDDVNILNIRSRINMYWITLILERVTYLSAIFIIYSKFIFNKVYFHIFNIYLNILNE